jgi:hypothetical protein
MKQIKEAKKVCLDIDDGSILRTRYDLLEKLKEHFPKLKVTLFWIPWDFEYETSKFRIQREELLERIKANLDWIQLVPHGLMHIEKEFENVDRQLMKDSLKAIDEAMQKDGLPYEKGFKAPFWLWNQSVVDVLNEQGWWGATDRNQPQMLQTKKNYIYTHSIEEPFYLSNSKELALHAHMRPPSINNIEDQFLNLMQMDPKWDFVYASKFVK